MRMVKTKSHKQKLDLLIKEFLESSCETIFPSIANELKDLQNQFKKNLEELSMTKQIVPKNCSSSPESSLADKSVSKEGTFTSTTTPTDRETISLAFDCTTTNYTSIPTGSSNKLEDILLGSEAASFFGNILKRKFVN